MQPHKHMKGHASKIKRIFSLPMKKIVLGLVVLIIASCKETTQQEVTPYADCISQQVVRELTTVTGKIEKVAEFYVIQTSEHRYSLCNLPQNLKVNGIEVVFDGQEMAIPANVRLIGTPVLITNIQQAGK